MSAVSIHTGLDRNVPANAANYSIVTVGNHVVLHFNSGVTNPPAVTNLAASAIQSFSATLHGQVLSTGGEFPTVRIYYGTTDGGSNPAAWTTNVSLGVQTGSFAAAVSNLTGNTTYYFAASASNSAGVAWGTPSLSFTTLNSNLAVMTNLAATAVQGNSAILNGQVVSIGSQTPDVTLYYGPSDGGTNAGAWANSVYLGQQGGSYCLRHFRFGHEHDLTISPPRPRTTAASAWAQSVALILHVADRFRDFRPDVSLR